MTASDWPAVWTTARLAFVSTLVLLILGVPLAWWLARSRLFFLRTAAEAVIALPLVLPPTVLGFYLLLVLGPRGPLAPLFEATGLRPLVFTFPGLVVGSVAYSLPFVVQPLRNAFAAIPPRAMEAAATLGAGPWDRFFSVALPLARRGIVTAAVLGFAHTVGEFGVVLMIGGNIPGKTRVLSIAIYDRVEAMDYARAHTLAGGLLIFSFLLLLGVYAWNRSGGRGTT